MKNQYDVIVIGGGAAGMMAAITAAKEGVSVAILEHKERVGAKILSTGNGKCNITNLCMNASCFHSDSSSDFYSVIEEYNEKSVIEFFRALGVMIHNKNGYIYPASEQAATILDALRYECEHCNIHIHTGQNVDSIEEICAKYSSNKNLANISEHKYTIHTSSGHFHAHCLIIACGSKAAPKTGSDGSGYTLAKYLGHKIIKPIPALTQIRCRGDFWKEIAGVRQQGMLFVYEDDHLITKEAGEIQFADYGLSGIPTFIISRTVLRRLDSHKNIIIRIDMMPDISIDELQSILKICLTHNDKLSLTDALNGILPKKLASLILKKAGLRASDSCDSITQKVYRGLAKAIKEFEVIPYDSNGFEHAQVCAGGVDLSEINLHTMESKIHSRLYFAGEILDVDGICGGYNLQWAFSSGHLAGIHAANNI